MDKERQLYQLHQKGYKAIIDGLKGLTDLTEPLKNLTKKEVLSPKVEVHVPEIKVPEIKVPQPFVSYTPPAINLPEQKPPVVNVDNKETNRLLSALLEEIKKKEEYLFTEDDRRKINYSGQEMVELLEKLKGKERLSYKSLKDAPDIEQIMAEQSSRFARKGEGVNRFSMLYDVDRNLSPNVGKYLVSKEGGTIGFGTPVGTIPLVADISDQFDGAQTSFSIPSFSSILMFNITGWPPNGSLRPIVDFTTPSHEEVSLTSEVSAPEAGTTGIIMYIPS